MAKENNNEKKASMALDLKGIKFLLTGLLVMISGYILMTGGGSDNPDVFSWAMFDFRRLVAAPIVIIAGIVIEVIAIMGIGQRSKEA